MLAEGGVEVWHGRAGFLLPMVHFALVFEGVRVDGAY